MEAMSNLLRISRQATLVMVVGLCIAATMAWAAPPKKNVAAEETGQYEPTSRVSIKSKMIDAVVTNVGDTYLLDDQTVIVGLNGKQVSARKMLVPCEAEISYDTQQGKRIARRITITKQRGDLKWQWGDRRPE
jgi:hypothetical protein